MSTLNAYRKTLKKWKLKEIPFRPTPPEDPEQLTQIFYGREKEIEIALPALYEGHNVLLKGAWGIGKTALILTLLYRLQKEVAELEEKMLVLYLGGISIKTPNDFYRAILLTVANSLAETTWDDVARDIANTVRGFSIQPSKRTTEGQVQLGFFSIGIKQESPDRELTPTTNADPYPLLLSLLDKAEQNFSRIVLAIDDLDKKDPLVVQDILEGSLDLFRRSRQRSFLIAGRSFTDLQETTLQALGIFSENISLKPMSQEALYQIAINYLNTAREEQQTTPTPFTEEVINQVIKHAQGTPRQLNYVCEKILRQAALERHEIINKTVFNSVWRTIQQEVTFSLTPQMRRLLYIAYETEGINEDIADQYLNQLGVSTFISLLPELKSLEERELLIRQTNESGYRFVPSKLFQPQLPPNSNE